MVKLTTVFCSTTPNTEIGTAVYSSVKNMQNSKLRDKPATAVPIARLGTGKAPSPTSQLSHPTPSGTVRRARLNSKTQKETTTPAPRRHARRRLINPRPPISPRLPLARRRRRETSTPNRAYRDGDGDGRRVGAGTVRRKAWRAPGRRRHEVQVGRAVSTPPLPVPREVAARPRQRWQRRYLSPLE